MITSMPASPRRSSPSARSSQTPLNKAALPGLVKPGRNSRLVPASAVSLIVVGEGEPYGKQEIAKALGLPVTASVANDPAAARHLSDGSPRPRKFDGSPLSKSLHTTATSVYAELQRTVERIGS